MAKVIFGNHTAVFAARSEQDRIRKFYCDVLGCNARVKTDEVDRFELDDFHFCFVYQNTALDEGSFLKAIYLELKTDNTEEMSQKMLASASRRSMFPINTFTFRLPVGKCLSSSESAKTSRYTRIHHHQDRDLLRRRRERVSQEHLPKIGV